MIRTITKFIQQHTSIKMKTIIQIKKQVDIKYVLMSVAVRYEDEDIPYDFPLRKGSLWVAKIDIDKGQIVEWPKGEIGNLKMKVCDQGSYFLIDENGETILSIEDDYVPNQLIPGSYGDYIDFQIDENGFITNWPKNPSIGDFTEECLF